MESVQDVFKFIFHHTQTIVFGNLGRYPEKLCPVLKDYPQLNIVILSPHYPFQADGVQNPQDPIESCDLLLYLEPPAFQTVGPYPMARRVAFFTSHLTFKLLQPSNLITFFYGPSDMISRNQELLQKQDFPVQARHVSVLQVNSLNVAILKGRVCNKPVQANTYFIIDLTEHTHNVLAMYLQCLDSFDFLISHLASIDRFLICFPEPNGLQGYSNFEQKSLDRLFCQTIEDGSSIQSILHKIPFYRSGTIDQKFDVKPTSFGNMPIVIPKSVQDACKAAIQYDLKPIVKNVFSI